MLALTYSDRLPLIPETTLREHRCHEPLDTRFRSAARLLQALWRDRKGLPMGSYVDGRGRKKKLGSRLNEFAGAAGGNFLDPQLQRLTRRELAYREPGAMIDEHRVWTNLLSSMPLTFNLFGFLKLQPGLATEVCKALWPHLVHEVCHIAFEHSPGRGDETFTADGSAFDVFIVARDDQGRKTFIAIEVKYSEAMMEPVAQHRPRYDELAYLSGLFIDDTDPQLRTNPLQQLFREHMLAESLLRQKLYDAGTFVCLAPKLNGHVQAAGRRYAEKLSNKAGTASFQRVTLEDFIAVIAGLGATEFTDAFTERYLDFAPVHALI